MPIRTLTAQHLDGANGGEPQRQNNGLIRIVGLSSGSNASNTTDQKGSRDDIIELAIQSFPIPKSNHNPTEVPYLNDIRKFASRRRYDDMQLVFTDYVNMDVAKILTAWWYQVQNPENGVLGFASQYKKQGEAILFAPNGDPQYERTYQIIGAWPSQFDPGDIDHGSDEPVRINLTLTVDKVIPKTGLNPGNGSTPRLPTF